MLYYDNDYEKCAWRLRLQYKIVMTRKRSRRAQAATKDEKIHVSQFRTGFDPANNSSSDLYKVVF